MDTKQLKGMIITEFLHESRINLKALRSKLLAHYRSVQELDEVLQLFVAAGMLQLESPDVYVMPQKQIDELKRLFSNQRQKTRSVTPVKETKGTRIRAIVIFDVDEDNEEFVEAEKLVGEFVKVKSGEYENLLMGTIISVEK